MLALRLAGQHAPLPARVWPLLSGGFRPFFLLGAAYALLMVPLWVVQVVGLRSSGLTMSGHAHEMLFGFGAAAVAGFLLTAVPNWTGSQPVHGGRLAALAGLWLLGRLPGPWGAGLDLAFLPCLGLALAWPLLATRQLRNLVFLPVLAWLWLADLAVWTGSHAQAGLEAGLLGILMLVVLVGGRVIPFFTRAAIPDSEPVQWIWVERACWASLPLLLLAEMAGLDARLLCLAAALAHALRLAGWHDPRVWRHPLLWVLHLGYAWLPMGLLLRAAGGSPMPSLHAFTVGCIGLLILGIMARVSLGHTGRALTAPAPVVAAFRLLAAAACLRCFGPLLLPAGQVGWLSVSGALWSLAFGLFLWSYAAILIGPRVSR